MRSLVKPPHGTAVAYLDFEQQEPAIAAAYSKDWNLAEAYMSGDIYLSMAKRFGLVPVDATKQSHPHERDMFKTVVLATQYGMGEKTLARRLRCSIETAKKLLDQHRQSYPDYWKWSDAAVAKVGLTGTISTVYGWNFTPGFDGFNSRAVRNFPMQGGGAEILRHACVLAHERGVKICAPIHDAVLIESAIDEIDNTVATCREAMIGAGRKVLGGFELRVEAHIVRYLDRYVDKRGVAMWGQAQKLLDALENGARAPIKQEDGNEYGVER
jgi:DNA polymerase I-like protein with 3'-5' exonuclease and polymerase domains